VNTIQLANIQPFYGANITNCILLYCKPPDKGKQPAPYSSRSTVPPRKKKNPVLKLDMRLGRPYECGYCGKKKNKKSVLLVTEHQSQTTANHCKELKSFTGSYCTVNLIMFILKTEIKHGT
jgi:hypothetical protein